MKRLLSFFILGAAVVIAIAATVKISDLPLATNPSTNTFIEIADMNAATKSLKYPLDSVPSYARITNAMTWSGNTNNVIGGDGRERSSLPIYNGSLLSIWGPSATDTLISVRDISAGESPVSDLVLWNASNHAEDYESFIHLQSTADPNTPTANLLFSASATNISSFGGFSVAPNASSVELRQFDGVTRRYLWLAPGQSPGISPYIFDTYSYRTEDLLQLYNFHTNKFSVAFDGAITAGSTNVWKLGNATNGAPNVEVNGTNYPLANATNAVQKTGDTMTGGLTNNVHYALTNDVFLERDSSNTLGLRNGTSAQVLNIYNTYTSPSAYEAIYMGWFGNSFYISDTFAGGGSARDINIGGQAPDVLLVTGNTQRWKVDGNGLFLPIVNNNYDIGASGQAVRRVYVATSILLGTNVLSFSGTNLTFNGGTVTVTYP